MKNSKLFAGIFLAIGLAFAPFARATVSDAEATAIVSEIRNHYEPLAKHHDAKLHLDIDWDAKRMGFFTAQFPGKNWYLSINGIQVRHPIMTQDLLYLGVCHELGHIFGGYPFSFGLYYQSVESQADYFAAQSCLRNIWKNQLQSNAQALQSVPKAAQERCDSTWKSQSERNLCYRISNVTLAFGNLLHEMRGFPLPSLEEHHYSQQEKKKDAFGHQSSQCRADTLMAGALCSVEFNEKVIPGKNVLEKNVLALPGFRNTVEAEREAGKFSCTRSNGLKVGIRPECWFKPLIK